MKAIREYEHGLKNSEKFFTHDEVKRILNSRHKKDL